MDTNRHDEFISLTNKITKYLIDKYNLRNNTTFGSSLIEARNKKNNIVKRFWDELNVYKELRNVLVHEQLNKYKLAEPHAYINDRLKHIYHALKGPTKIREMANGEVLSFNINDKLSNVLEAIKIHDYTQFPIFSEKLEGLLTENGIAKWLASQIDNDIVEISNTKLGDIIRFDEHARSYKIKSPNDSLFEVLDLFEDKVLQNYRPITILVSNNPKEINLDNIQGIITYWDMEKIKLKLDLNKGV